MVTASGHRAKARCDALGVAPFSETQDGLYRPYLSDAHEAALGQVTTWMHEAGMTTRIDAAGNLIGRWGEGDKSLIIASHIDSVRDAGRYDGPLGVMLGIEVCAALSASGEALPFAIEVYAFGDEEGSRFPASMLCSRAVCGQVTPDMLNVADADGISLAEALASKGLNIERFLDARRDPAELAGYLEAHIEQGPVLEAEGLALGVVTAIAAQRRYELRVTGVAGHAGTNAMALRTDAFTATAEMALAAERIARDGPSDLVATIGKVSVKPGAANVVPGEVVFSLDVRAGDETVCADAAETILAAFANIASTRRAGLETRLIHILPASPCDAGFMQALDLAVAATGQPTRRIVSGAGHDAMAFAGLTPTAMLFIRCEGGISHNPREAVTAEDCEQVLSAMLHFVRSMRR